ncbi:hypothetical protein NLI96_g318 [Meripilus lineatus]|uniref:Serine protease n=1 Tax=Meripilus lineatus TaxID=2056292 RepID=A0AAD5YP24_9APHY|nr:hypothetical protein NLI96_g318 [Physisporinus lineatus]
MRLKIFTLISATLALLVAPSIGVPSNTLVEVQKFDGKIKEGSYIVKLKDNVSKSSHLGWLGKQLGSDKITHSNWEKGLLHGFAGKFSEKTLSVLRSSPDVEYIAEDGIVTAFSVVTQTNAPWGIARLSQDARLANQNSNALNFTYRYESVAGAGADIYVVDTGVYTAHTEFGGRARWGATFGGYPSADGNGHGTHIAATAAGARFGVAKQASIIAVKVLSDAGSGTISDIISGLNFVASSAAASGRPTLVLLALGGGVSLALDNAVNALINSGIYVIVAAGGSATDVGNTSPARVPAAFTVGASSIADAVASFSNYGPGLDIFAPGVGIISAWITSPTATIAISGSSSSAAHVTGLLAYLISRNPGATQAQIGALLNSLALKNVLTGVPTGTKNYLARNDIPG